MATKYVSGGGKLKAALKKLSQQIDQAGTLKVGFLEGVTYPGTRTPVALVAAVQEFGTYNTLFPIPPRPYFRNMIKAKSGEWPSAIEKTLKRNDYDTAKTLFEVGGNIAGQLRQSIIEISSPPLSEVTLMLRKMKSEGGENYKVTRRTVFEAVNRVKAGERSGRTGPGAKPLIDSGIMLDSVDFEVSD